MPINQPKSIRPGEPWTEEDYTRFVEELRFISHGEGEKAVLRNIPSQHIRGGWEIVEGQPRWFDNPNFGHSIMNGSKP